MGLHTFSGVIRRRLVHSDLVVVIDQYSIRLPSAFIQAFSNSIVIAAVTDLGFDPS